MFAEFVHEVWNAQRYIVPPSAEDFPRQLDTELTEALNACFAADLLEAPAGAPSPDLTVALQGARVIWVAGRALVIRELPESFLQEMTGLPAPGDPAVIYSMDLFLRFLPSIYRLAARIAPEDPLVKQTEIILPAWPLSAVGSGVCEEGALEPILSNEYLRLMLLDRIIKKQDFLPLQHLQVRQAMRQRLGSHSESFPAIHQAIERYESSAQSIAE